MLYRNLFAVALFSGLAFAPIAEAGHSDPTVRLGVDVIWGGGYFRPAPVAWYPAPVYSYGPPPVYGRPYWAGGRSHHRHHRHIHRHHDRYDDWNDDWEDDRNDWRRGDH